MVPVAMKHGKPGTVGVTRWGARGWEVPKIYTLEVHVKNGVACFVLFFRKGTIVLGRFVGVSSFHGF